MVRFNENNEVIRNEEYTAILAGIQLREDISYSMEELAGLAEADGVAVAGQMIQSLERPNTATLQPEQERVAEADGVQPGGAGGTVSEYGSRHGYF